ncbi:MAG: hypothetical protein K2X25_02650 [Caulobacteraceae bacterium]|nr:hypothetical protein [Caulobacteraceae bacterium]
MPDPDVRLGIEEPAWLPIRGQVDAHAARNAGGHDRPPDQTIIERSSELFDQGRDSLAPQARR